MANEQQPISHQAHAQPLSPQQLASQREAFVKHLEQASSVVQTWPVWKQQLLGGTAAQQTANIVIAMENKLEPSRAVRI